MATKILEISTESAIPEFVPFGVIYYAEDTGFLWLGTGSSAPGANVVLIDSPPGGFGSSGVGDIQYNNGGELGGSAATITAAGAINALSITATSATIGALTATAENIVTSTITSAFVTNETVTTLTFADSTSMTTAMTFGRVIATALGMNMN